MFRIELFFKSNVKGIYTFQKETCENDYWKDSKVNRMLVHWCDILCRYIDTSKLPLCDNIVDHNILLNQLIQVEIKRLNSQNKEGDQDRTFDIEVYEDDKLVQCFE